MKRKEFIESFVRLTREGRRRRFPGTAWNHRAAEEVCNAVDDAAVAAKIWRKYRAALVSISVEAWELSQAPEYQSVILDEEEEK